MTSGLALTEHRANRSIVALGLILITTLGGCGGGDEEGQAPARIHITGGEVQSDRLEDSVAKWKGDVVGRQSPSKKAP